MDVGPRKITIDLFLNKSWAKKSSKWVKVGIR